MLVWLRRVAPHATTLRRCVPPFTANGGQLRSHSPTRSARSRRLLPHRLGEHNAPVPAKCIALLCEGSCAAAASPAAHAAVLGSGSYDRSTPHPRNNPCAGCTVTQQPVCLHRCPHCYAPCVPDTTPGYHCCLFARLVLQVVWRYHCLYFYERQYESGGRLWETLFTLMVSAHPAAIMFGWCCMAVALPGRRPTVAGGRRSSR